MLLWSGAKRCSRRLALNADTSFGVSFGRAQVLERAPYVWNIRPNPSCTSSHAVSSCECLYCVVAGSRARARAFLSLSCSRTTSHLVGESRHGEYDTNRHHPACTLSQHPSEKMNLVDVAGLTVSMQCHPQPLAVAVASEWLDRFR